VVVNFLNAEVKCLSFASQKIERDDQAIGHGRDKVVPVRSESNTRRTGVLTVVIVQVLN
jgi:hypothetical protein